MSASRQIRINPVPKISFGLSDSSGCQPLQFRITNNSTNADYYHWEVSSNNVLYAISDSVNPWFNLANDGLYNVKVIAQNNFTCKDSTLKANVNVYPKPVVSITSDSTSCGPSKIKFHALVNAKGTNCSYFWDMGNGKYVSSVNLDTSIYYSVYGSDEVSFLVQNEYQCKDTANKNFRICKAPKIQIQPENEIGCHPLNIKFDIVNNAANTNEYIWNFGDGSSDTTSSNDNQISHYFTSSTFDGITNYTIQVRGIGQCGCFKDTILKDKIQVYPNVAASFVSKHLGNLPREIDFTNLSSPNADEFSWSFGDNSSTSSDKNPTHQYSSFGTFNVILTAIDSRYNCPATYIDTVKINDFWALYVPNALVPESADMGVNEFKPTGIGMKDYHLYIYDTWGNLLWETSELNEKGQPTQGWNGRNKKGELLPQDVYVWVIEASFINGDNWEGKNYKGGMTRRQGTVTLLR